MALPGEVMGTRKGETVKCSCGKELELQVLQSAAGYYIGHMCKRCGPFSRESGYYKSQDAAQKALDEDSFKRTHNSWASICKGPLPF